MLNKCMICLTIGFVIGMIVAFSYVRSITGIISAERRQRAIEMNVAEYDTKTGEFRYNNIFKYVLTGEK